MQYLEDKNGNVRRPAYVFVNDLISGNVYTHGVDFSSVFENGFTVWENSILGDNSSQDHEDVNGTDNRSGGEESNISDRRVLALSKFLSEKDFHDEALEVMFYRPFEFNFKYKHVENLEKLIEGDVVVLLANHMFSQLAVKNTHLCGGNDTYIVSSNTKNKKFRCPCAKRCDAGIRYGNTEFDSEYLWYGQTDIMMFPESGDACSIMLLRNQDNLSIEDKDLLDNEADINNIDFNSDSSPIRSHSNIQRIVSQTITFSFYQNKIQKLKQLPTTSMVPIIAACKDAFDIYLYNFENDILLRNMGEPIPLFKNYKLDVSAIIKLWMLINYTSFCPSLEEVALTKLRNTCGLRQRINTLDKQNMDVIMATLKMKHHEGGATDPYFHDVRVEYIR